MDVQERFYGAAMREIEQGVRRDDLWIKAMARAEGDLQKAKAFYVDLLAHVLSDAEASARIKKIKGASATLAINAGRKAFYIVRLIAVLLVFLGASGSLFELIRSHYQEHYANTYRYSSSRDNETPLVYTNSAGRSLTALTAGQCYEAEVARSTGYGYEKLNGLQREIAKLDSLSISSRYRDYVHRKQITNLYYIDASLADDLNSCSSEAAAKHFAVATRRINWDEIAWGWPILFSSVSVVCLLVFLLLTKLLVRPLYWPKK